jgi:hypothetical protein
VFDLRGGLRAPLLSLPCVAPALLAWHPVWHAQLLVASSGGMFSMLDVNNYGAATASYQLDTGGDALAAASFAASGEALAFGGSGGGWAWGLGQHDPHWRF